MNITNTVKYIGVNDRAIDLFEGQYRVPHGISYNSYIIFDERIAVMDTVDAAFTEEWLGNLDTALGGRAPDYLIIQHMEPDHSANIMSFMNKYPTAAIVSSAKAFSMMKNFFGRDFTDRRIVVAEGDTLNLGDHELRFITAPMVHWPEVILTYELTENILFSADAFGKFGTPDTDEPWEAEARRYYIGIVGKYGAQVQSLLKKASELEIKKICPLHGPILSEDISHYIDLYGKWSSYEPEEEGVAVCYASIYGNTKRAALYLADKLSEKGCAVTPYDLTRCDMSMAVADAFKYSALVLASATYNGDVFPPMREFTDHLTERGYKNRCVAIIENGSWAPMAAKSIKKRLEECKNLTFTQSTVTIHSAMNADTLAKLDELATELSKFK